MSQHTVSRRLPTLSAAFMLAFLFALPVLAQSPAANPAAAQALYDEAKRLADVGDYPAACPKFKESYRLDPGGGTLLNLANCYEKQGKTALAWSTFKEALVVARRDGREDRMAFANSEIASLESRMARLIVRVPIQVRVSGLAVNVDGATLGEAAWDVAMPIDPGQHVVRAEAPGKRPFSTSITVSSAAAARSSVDVPQLENGLADSRPEGHTTAAAEATGTTNAGSATRGTVGWIVGGIGIASVGVGSYFGLRAFSRWSDRNAACAGGCTEAAVSAGEEARQAATISTFCFGAGIVAVGVGTYLVLTRRGEAAHPAATALSVAPVPMQGGAGLWMRGRF